MPKKFVMRGLQTNVGLQVRQKTESGHDLNMSERAKRGKPAIDAHGRIIFFDKLQKDAPPRPPKQQNFVLHEKYLMQDTKERKKLVQIGALDWEDGDDQDSQRFLLCAASFDTFAVVMTKTSMKMRNPRRI
jgi:hypothetical protein